jgi:hypothetical protein
MTKKAEEYLQNTIGVYCHLKMAMNHISCIKGSHASLSKHDKYMQNKMAKLEKEVEATIRPIEKYLTDTGTIGEVEDMILQMHTLIDPIISK